MGLVGQGHGGVDEKETSAMLDQAIDSTLDKVKSFRVFASPAVAAVDTHDLPRYDRDMDGGFLRRGRRDRGTTKHEVYATLQSVEERRRAQIACEQFGVSDEREEVVRTLLTKARLDGSRSPSAPLQVFLLLCHQRSRGELIGATDALHHLRRDQEGGHGVLGRGGDARLPACDRPRGEKGHLHVGDTAEGGSSKRREGPVEEVHPIRDEQAKGEGRVERKEAPHGIPDEVVHREQVHRCGAAVLG